MTRDYDAIIIGTGQAGPPLAARFDREGRKVAVIERHKIGGSCVNAGCIPTKTLVASARVAQLARRAAEYGILVEGDVRADMKQVKARMREISGQSNRGVTRWLEGMDNVTLYRAHARFEGPDTVRVGDELLRAGKIFLNVGTRARVPDMPGLDEIDYLTSTGILELEELPEHLIVIGGSYVGLEFAQMYRRFGSRVTLVEMGPRLIGREDEDVSAAANDRRQDPPALFLGGRFIHASSIAPAPSAWARVREPWIADEIAIGQALQESDQVFLFGGRQLEARNALAFVRVGAPGAATTRGVEFEHRV